VRTCRYSKRYALYLRAWDDLEASGNIFSPQFTADWARKTIATRYVGAAHVAEKSGDSAKAQEYYRKVLAVANGGEATRTEVADARAFMAKKR
jgi:hypothetical protein